MTLQDLPRWCHLHVGQQQCRRINPGLCLLVKDRARATMTLLFTGCYCLPMLGRTMPEFCKYERNLLSLRDHSVRISEEWRHSCRQSSRCIALHCSAAGARTQVRPPLTTCKQVCHVPSLVARLETSAPDQQRTLQTYWVHCARRALISTCLKGTMASSCDLSTPSCMFAECG